MSNSLKFWNSLELLLFYNVQHSSARVNLHNDRIPVSSLPCVTVCTLKLKKP